MTTFGPLLTGAWRNLRSGLARRGLWGLAPGEGATAGAHLSREPDGTIRLNALRVFGAGGTHPTRRAADIAAAIARPSGSCVLLLPAEECRSVFVAGLPVPVEERRDALRWRLKDELDFPAEDAIVDCVTAMVSNPAFDHGLWLAVAARRGRVHEIAAPLSGAGIDVTAVDVPELAQRNLAMRFVEPGHAVAMLTIDARHALLTVSRDDGMLAIRQFDPLAVALSESDDERRGALLDRLALELQRTFDNVERQYSAGPIDRVIVFRTPSIPELIKPLSIAIAVPIEPFVLERVCVCTEAGLAAQVARNRTALLAIGAALRCVDGEPA